MKNLLQIRSFNNKADLMLKTLFLVIIINLATAFPAFAENADIKKALDNWVSAVESGNPQTVANLYDSKSVLLPTLSNIIKDSPEKRLEYFKRFATLPQLKCKIVNLYSRVYGDVGVNSGLYDFKYEKDGKIVDVQARFSFVYHKTDKGWLIVDHQSSKMPE